MKIKAKEIYEAEGKNKIIAPASLKPEFTFLKEVDSLSPTNVQMNVKTVSFRKDLVDQWLIMVGAFLTQCSNIKAIFLGKHVIKIGGFQVLKLVLLVELLNQFLSIYLTLVGYFPRSSHLIRIGTPIK